ncbi:MAG: TonB-dependent receptor [Pseudomonadota bacterium]
MKTLQLQWRFAALVILFPPCVLGQAPEDKDYEVIHSSYVIDEIVVEADYLGRTLRRLPASITALDAEQIQSQSIQHFEELVNTIPNLNWSGDGHRARYFQIRGIGERSQYEGAPNPSVGYIVDDIDFSGIGTIGTLFDMESVEVLRGPQAIRYGANALAGLIYLRSTTPTVERNGRARVIVGDDNTFGAGIATGGELGDGSLFRISADHYQSDGFRDNPFLNRTDTNGREETSLRAKLVHETEAQTLLTLTGMYVNIDNGYDAFALDNSLTMLSDDPGKDTQESVGASFRIEQPFEGFDFTSITAFADSDIEFNFDADWGNQDSWAPIVYDFQSLNDRERSTISQDFRLATESDSGTQWLFGLYALRLEEDLDTLNLGVYDDGSFAGNFDEPLFSSQYEATSVAAYSQAIFDLIDGVQLDVGLRIENRSTDYSDSNATSASPSETMNGGHAILTFLNSNRMSTFVGISKGFKAGGFNLGVVPDGRRDFDREELWNIETGVRALVLNDRLDVSATLFYSVRDDQQVSTSFQLDPNDPASFIFFTDNATKSTSIGLEADVRWQASDRVELYATLGLLDTEFDDFVTEEVDNTGRALAHAPDYTFSAGGVWAHENGWFARLDVTGRDAFFFSDSHDQRSESYELVNARVGYDAEQWSVELWARNLFDEDYAVRGFFFGNEPPNFPDTLYTRAGDPRHVGLTAEYRF